MQAPRRTRAFGSSTPAPALRFLPRPSTKTSLASRACANVSSSSCLCSSHLHWGISHGLTKTTFPSPSPVPAFLNFFGPIRSS